MKVPVNVVSLEGNISNEPAETGEVEPTVPVMKPCVAFVEVHETMTDWPGLIVEAETDTVHAGPGGGVTVTVTGQVIVPPAPVNVPV